MLDYGEISLPSRWCVETPEQIICAAAAQMITTEPTEVPVSR